MRRDSTLGAALTGMVEQLGGARQQLDPNVRVDGEHILVTGASSGLGLALTVQLAERGATVWMACRSRHEDAVREVKTHVPHADVRMVPLDLTVPAQVSGVAVTLGAQGVVLDRVVLNAGAVASGSRTTASGLDVMVHTNFVANVQLVRSLMRSDRLREGTRLLVVGSDAHRTASVDLDRWMEPAGYGVSGAVAAYGESKWLVHSWAEALAVRAPQLEVIHLCPGAIASNIAREAPASLSWALRPVMALLFPSPRRVARTVAWIALSPEFAGRTGVYLHLGRERSPGPGVRDPEVGTSLWDSAQREVDRITG